MHWHGSRGEWLNKCKLMPQVGTFYMAEQSGSVSWTVTKLKHHSYRLISIKGPVVTQSFIRMRAAGLGENLLSDWYCPFNFPVYPSHPITHQQHFIHTWINLLLNNPRPGACKSPKFLYIRSYISLRLFLFLWVFPNSFLTSSTQSCEYREKGLRTEENNLHTLSFVTQSDGIRSTDYVT